MRWFVGITLLVFLFLGTYVVLKPFLSPLAWAGVLCYTTWPAYRGLLARLGGRQILAAWIMLLLIIVAVALPVLYGSWRLATEVQGTMAKAREVLHAPPEAPSWLKELPIVGVRVETLAKQWHEDPESIKSLILKKASSFQDLALDLGGRLGKNIVKLGLTLLTLFFFYLSGEEVVEQTRKVARRFAGEQVQRRFQNVGQTIRAVVYGLLLTAMAQGVLAGIGYLIAGVGAPLLLGAATGLLALIPFGAPLIWVPAGLWLLMQGLVFQGILLLLWGALLVSTIDNVLRPYFISGATRIPYLLVFFGVLGGVGAFGLIGLFIGPTILSVLLALWREWVSEAEEIMRLKESKTNA